MFSIGGAFVNADKRECYPKRIDMLTASELASKGKHGFNVLVYLQ
jgi:hypothetical protein